MNSGQLAKVWAATGLFELYYVLNTWLTLQGGTPIFGGALSESFLGPGRVQTALAALFIVTSLAILNASFAIVYAARAGADTPWHGRIPIVGFDHIDTASGEGQLYQGAMLFFISILPMGGLAHFWGVLETGKLAPSLKGACAALRADLWATVQYGSEIEEIRLCSPDETVRHVPHTVETCMSSGITFFPPYETRLVLMLTLLAGGLVAFQILRLFIGRRVAVKRHVSLLQPLEDLGVRPAGLAQDVAAGGGGGGES